MATAFTPQQSLAMAYARLRGLRDDLADAEPSEIESICAQYDRALDDLQTAGFDLAPFKLDSEEHAGDRNSWLQARLDALLDYMDLFAGLP